VARLTLCPDQNTIQSFQKALDLACDEVETDVWLMPDGAFVIAHDRPRVN
jgi:glycerophosphoryl diester phosphodiesterase